MNQLKERYNASARTYCIYEATRILSSSSYPTIEEIRTIFFVIIMHLTEVQDKSNSIKSHIAEKIIGKLDKYWDELQSYFPEAVLLDPSSKFSTFRSSDEKRNAHQIINAIYDPPIKKNTSQ